jgi:translin
MLTGLEEITEQIRGQFDLLDAAREKAYEGSRQVIRSASVTIKHVHRSEMPEARAQLAETRRLTHEMLGAVAQAPELRYGGFVSDAEKEYVEAAVVLACIAGEPLPSPEDLGVYPAAWLNGLAEVVGEFRRYVLDRIRTDDNERAELFLEAADSIYQIIMTFDYPNAISLGLRSRSDAARGLVERTRGDLTTALRAGRLEKRMIELENKLNEAAQ